MIHIYIYIASGTYKLSYNWWPHLVVQSKKYKPMGFGSNSTFSKKTWHMDYLPGNLLKNWRKEGYEIPPKLRILDIEGGLPLPESCQGLTSAIFNHIYIIYIWNTELTKSCNNPSLPVAEWNPLSIR